MVFEGLGLRPRLFAMVLFLPLNDAVKREDYVFAIPRSRRSDCPHPANWYRAGYGKAGRLRSTGRCFVQSPAAAAAQCPAAVPVWSDAEPSRKKAPFRFP